VDWEAFAVFLRRWAAQPKPGLPINPRFYLLIDDRCAGLRLSSSTAETFEGDPCYADLPSIPGGVDGVVIATRPTVTEELVRQCVAAHVPRVWMHESLIHGGTSVSADAIVTCREHDITLIAGACPMMYCTPVDFGHQCMRWMMRVTGGLPE